MLYPLTFQPIFKERVWGGRQLEKLYHKPLPHAARIGESWEISDRRGDVSVMMEHHKRDLLGDAWSLSGRFPLLIKILDCVEKLSLQVHPPAKKGAELRGEPKTEMWYIAQAAPESELYVGLKKGVTRDEFETKLKAGDVADCFHRIPVQPGDAMFLPSGRVHAIGGGLVIFEIQQNSDTTYRVFDWNRAGLDGKPRELHVEKSLASINFDDVEPPKVSAPPKTVGNHQVRTLVKDPLFEVELIEFQSTNPLALKPGVCSIVGVVEKRLIVVGIGAAVELKPGAFCLIPAGIKGVDLCAEAGARALSVRPGVHESR